MKRIHKKLDIGGMGYYIFIMENYTTAEILKITGLNRNTFQDWLTRGFITPSIRASTRQGELNVFTKDDLILTLLFKKITMMGFTRPQTARFVAAFKKITSLPIGAASLEAITWVVFRRFIADGKEKLVVSHTTITDPVDLAKGNFLTNILFTPGHEPPDDINIVNIGKIIREALEKE